MKVIILAAGKGTRMEGSPDNFSKCATRISHTLGPYDTPITRLISQVTDQQGFAVSDVIVVGGYGIESVSNAIKEYINFPCHLIYNDKYETLGCNYSLSCATQFFSGAEDVLILEGDSIYKEGALVDFIKRALNLNESSSLVRDSYHLNDSSVCVMVDRTTRKVIRYVYDSNHKIKDCLNRLYEFEGVALYDSMQAWLIKGKDTSYLRSRLSNYFEDRRPGKNHSGVYSINQAITDGVVFRPLLCNPIYENSWINLNTKEDLSRVESLVSKGEL